ncbi:MAG: MFS transporter [Patescibacteria group bacterium]
MPRQPKINKNRLPLLILYFLGFLLAVSNALPAYIQSNFLRQFVSLNLVSLFFVVANLLTVTAIIFFPKWIKKLKNYFLTKLVLVVYLTSLLGLTLATSSLTALFSIILFTITTNLLWINMDVLVENFSADNSTGKTRTIYFTAINLGWIISPAFSSYLISRGEYTLIFLVAAFLVVPFFLIFLAQKRHLKSQAKYSKEKITLTVKKMWRIKNLRGIFFISLLLQLFYSSAVVYIPIYLHQNLGMDWGILGILFSLMLIPFIILEIPAGIIADKYIGEKEIMFIGVFILAASLFLFYSIETPTIWLWGAVLFASRVGASLIEAMRETYFFKIVAAKDVGYINIFRMTAPLGYIIGPGLAILITSYLPLNYLFLILAIIMLSGFGFIASIKDTK